MNNRTIKNFLSFKILTLALTILPASLLYAGTTTRTSSFEYDPNTGLLLKQIVEPNDPQHRLETAYLYDAFGNVTTTTISSPAIGSGSIETRSNVALYDGIGRFPVVVKNALLHEQLLSFSPAFGQINSVKDANNLTTSWEYDSLGRKKLEVRADGTKTTWTYAYCAGTNSGTVTCPNFAAYRIETNALDVNGSVMESWVRTYYDNLNRPIKTETLGFDGVTTINVDTIYDNFGRVSRSSLPYYNGEGQEWSYTYYDRIGRVSNTMLPGGNQTTIDYNGLATTVTNGVNQKTIKTRDALGRLKQVTDNASKNIDYLYDDFDNLIQTSDAQGNLIQLTYDILGHKKQMTDPDMGVWNYEYDVLGALKKQTDAKKQETTIAYDKLGRMTKRSEPDLNSIWVYDACSTGVGKLCAANTDNKYSRIHNYDALGRPISTSTSIDTVYNSSVSYDSLSGRVSSRTYPNGFALQYDYTNLGYLSQVKNKKTSLSYWKANVLDAQGHILQQTYGNNVLTQKEYKSGTSYLSAIYAGSGNTVQNSHFLYNNIGNLEGRDDAIPNYIETFLYDPLNRLYNSTVNSGGTKITSHTYEFDGIGNLTARSDVGSYFYGDINRKPHAIQYLNVQGKGYRQFEYDDNGNLTKETRRDSQNKIIGNDGRSISYSSFNMPLKMSSLNGVSLDFVYGPEHQRTKLISNSSTTSSTTIYLNPDESGGLLYEKESKPNGTVEHRNFITAGGQVIAVAKQVAVDGAPIVSYFHQDNMGSTTAITNESGAVIERLAYEPFGKRRFNDGDADSDNSVKGTVSNRGYTNHEHLEALGLIHMNGRVYDPTLARFMSADPFIQAPDDMQSFNRYSYVMNTPFMYTDPSGFFAWKEYKEQAKRFFSKALNNFKYSGNGNFDGTKSDAPSSGLSSAQSEGRLGTVETVASSDSSANSRGATNNGTAQQLKDGYTGDTRSVMFQETGAETIGRYTHNVVDFGVNLLPGSSFPDVGAALGRGEYGAAVLLLGTELLGPLGKEGRALAGLEKATAKYEVGTFKDLKAGSVVGDGLDIHHAVQKSPASQVISGYDALKAPAIAIPQAEHRLIPTISGQFGGTARDLLSKDIRDLRNYTNAPNSSLRQLIDLNKEINPSAFVK